MSRRSKFSPELKLAVVSHVIGGKCSVAKAAREVDVKEISISSASRIIRYMHGCRKSAIAAQAALQSAAASARRSTR